MPKRADRIAREQARAAEIDQNKPEAPSEFKIGDAGPGARVWIPATVSHLGPYNAERWPRVAVKFDSVSGHRWFDFDQSVIQAE